MTKKVETVQKEHDDLVKAVGTAKTGMGEAETTWKELKGKAEVALKAVETPLEQVKALRTKVTEAQTTLEEKMKARDAKQGEVDAAAKALAAEDVKVAKATEACKAAKYDLFMLDVAKAKSDRDTKLKAIENLIAGRTKYAHGATKGRCEKPQSNGDRIRRGKCAAETDCCGAATGRPHGAVGPLVTIEVCLPKTDKTYQYIAPRAAMADADPAPASWPFKCIDGASKLAGAAAAVLASAYMMA